MNDADVSDAAALWRAGDFRHAVAAAGRRLESRRIFGLWVRDHFEALNKTLGHAGGLASTIGWTCDAGSQQAAPTFFDKHLSFVEGMQRSYEERLSQSRLCIQMRERHLAATSAFLDAHR